MLLNSQPGLFRRFKFYGFGFLLGMLLVGMLFRGRTGCKSPSTLKIEELRAQPIEYTQHATCRMKCRDISEEEVKYVINNGTINYDKSNVHDTPCGTYAVEATTQDAQHIRIVIADCGFTSKIVTAIDLGSEQDKCECK